MCFMDNNNTNSKAISLSTISYLSKYEEEIPQWLFNYPNGGKVTFSDIMSERVGYYPGSGFDGTLMRIGNKSNSVHSFLYVDYAVRKNDLIKNLLEPRSIYGYHSIGRIEWEEKDIMPNGQYPLNVFKKPRHNQDPNWFVLKDEQPYCFTEIMERNEDKGNDWGAKRFAITFLFADGIATYYQVFCREYKKAPWLFLLKDHGWGGNYDLFGKGGILDAIIERNDIRPNYVLCAQNTEIWDGFGLVDGVRPELGDSDNSTIQLWQ